MESAGGVAVDGLGAGAAVGESSVDGLAAGGVAGCEGASAGFGWAVGFVGAGGICLGVGGVSDWDISSRSKMRSALAGMTGGRPASPYASW